MVEADQQIAAKANAFPAEEQDQQVVAQHQHQHGEHKQVHVGEEAAVAARLLVILPHVAGGVDVNEEANAGDDAHHHQRQRIQIKHDGRLEAADGHPRPQRHRHRRFAALHERIAGHQGNQRRQPYRASANHGHQLVWQPALGDEQQRKAE